MTETRKGIVAILAVSTLWGLSGIYFDRLREVPAAEVLAHRVVWSLVFFLGLFAAQGRLGALLALYRDRQVLAVLSVSTLLVAINWYGFIWAIQNGYATQASLGYYILPLVIVFLGMAVFGERPGRRQVLAIALAAAAVVVLTLGLGAPPWISLLLGFTFAVYGMLKKLIAVGPAMSVAGEVLLLFPLALAWLIHAHLSGAGAFGSGLSVSFWLILSAGFTGLPLVIFSYASKRLAYSTLGVLNYVNPTLQFLVAMIYFGEAFTRAHAIAFPLIWAGVILYSVELWRQDSAASSSSTV